MDACGLGPLDRGVGQLVVAALARIADVERQRIKERRDSAEIVARASLAVKVNPYRGRHVFVRPATNA